MASARWKLVSLWLSQTARVTADNALRFFVCLEYANQGVSQRNSAWYLVNAIFTMPAVFLAPFNGAICNTLPKHSVLRWSALFGVVAGCERGYKMVVAAHQWLHRDGNVHRDPRRHDPDPGHRLADHARARQLVDGDHPGICA
jgi:hypothetical protein